MRVGMSVKKSIDDWVLGDFESAMLHACNAVDGTAKKSFPSISVNKERFTRLLRDNYNILGPMGIPGIDLVQTRFPIALVKPTASGGQPDLADIIYGVHRCSHGHGDELPQGFELIPDAARERTLTRNFVSKGKINLSDRIIFGLLAIVVASSVNFDQTINNDYYLTFDKSVIFIISEWWGRHVDLLAVINKVALPMVKLDFGDWMN